MCSVKADYDTTVVISGVRIEWTNDGEVLAVGGFIRQPNLECHSYLQFYNPGGTLRCSVKVPSQVKQHKNTGCLPLNAGVPFQFNSNFIHIRQYNQTLCNGRYTYKGADIFQCIIILWNSHKSESSHLDGSAYRSMMEWNI